MINELAINPNINLVYVYQKEAHAADVWPIGLSAGTINLEHKTLEERQSCANKFIKELCLTNLYNSMYLDSMDNTVLYTLSAWPFRYYCIRWDLVNSSWKFTFIANPLDAEFDLTQIYSLV